jgi:hypothetical protein
MDQLTEQLKKIHYTWLALAGLWFLAFVLAAIDVMHKPAPAFNYGPPPSHALQTLFMFAFVAYLVGGFVLGKIHNRHVARFTNASYQREQKGETIVFHVTPARRHLPFWLFGLFGAFFIFSVPHMLAGDGAGTFFTVLLAAAFAAMGLQPRLWRAIPPHDFSFDASVLKAGGETVVLEDIKGFVFGTSLRGKSDNAKNQGVAYPQAMTQTVYMTGNPIAAHGMMAAQQIGVGASAAAGQGIAEIANRYFYEMRARSHRIEAVRGGSNLVVAKGLDIDTAQALMAEVVQAAAGGRPSAV